MLLEPSKKELRASPNSSHRNTCILPNYEIRADPTRSSVILYKTWTRTYPSERKNRGWRKTRIAVNERSLPGSRREREKGEEGISCELVGRDTSPPKLRRPTSSRRPRLKNESVYIGPRLISPPSRHSCNQWVGRHSPFSFPPLIRPYRVHALLPSLIFAIVNRPSSSPLFHCVTLASNLDISFSSFIYRGRIMEELLARLYNAPSGRISNFLIFILSRAKYYTNLLDQFLNERPTSKKLLIIEERVYSSNESKEN